MTFPFPVFCPSTSTVDAFTVLMLHMDGADASTIFADSSSGAKTVTAVGNAQIDTAQSVFGGASGLFDGTGDYLTLADHADWDFPGDFTIDFRYRPAADGAFQALGAHGDANAATGYRIQRNTSNRVEFVFSGTNNVLSTTSLIAGAWYHIEIGRSGSTLYGFINGTLEATVACSNNFTDTGLFYIGDSGSGSLQLNGWLDEYRVSKGIARHTSSFTPPTSAY